MLDPSSISTSTCALGHGCITSSLIDIALLVMWGSGEVDSIMRWLLLFVVMMVILAPMDRLK